MYNAQSLVFKNEFFPYILHKLLLTTEKARLVKVREAFIEGLNSIEESKTDQSLAYTSARKLNPLLAASTQQLEQFVENWIPKLNLELKTKIIACLSVGDCNNPGTSAWKSDAYLALIKQVLDSLSIQEYNDQILFKEHYFEDKEWLADMTDGEDLIEAVLAEERAKAALESPKKGKGAKK